MPEGWRTVRLGDVLVSDNSKLGAHGEEPVVFSLSKYDGVVLADDYFDKRIASDKLDGYKVLGPGGWAYSTIHIDEGSIATNRHGLTGVLSPMYTTMRWVGQDDDPRYFELLLRTPRMLTVYRDHAAGTVNRRRSLAYKAFAELRVDVPPLVMQRRVVDLVDAVDTYAAAAGRAAAETRRALDAHLEGFDTWTVSDGTALGDRASMGSGPSWKAEQERSVAGPGTLPVVKITNTRPDGRLVMDERAFVADLPASTGVLDEDSLVMIRTNGNRDRIGNVYRCTPETVGHAVSAFQIAVHPFDPADSAYLFWYLRSPRVQRLISEAASGTTGLGNVAVRWLRQLEVPWPDASTRAVFVDTAEAMLTASESASDVGEGLSGLRSALLGELLAGDREIPGSYDELVRLVA